MVSCTAGVIDRSIRCLPSVSGFGVHGESAHLPHAPTCDAPPSPSTFVSGKIIPTIILSFLLCIYTATAVLLYTRSTYVVSCSIIYAATARPERCARGRSTPKRSRFGLKILQEFSAVENRPQL